MRDELYLIDSSVWLEVLPPGGAASTLRTRVDSLVAADVVATTGMVRLEILAGARSEAEYRRLDSLLSALHPLELTEKLWDEAARLGFQMRRQGLAIPSTELAIAAVAMMHEAVLVHRDRHFNLIAEHHPLKVENHLAP